MRVVTRRTCQVTIGFEHHHDVLCGKPAVLIIDRRENGKLAVCNDCANEPEIYEDVRIHSYAWTALEEVTNGRPVH